MYVLPQIVAHACLFDEQHVWGRGFFKFIVMNIHIVRDNYMQCNCRTCMSV